MDSAAQAMASAERFGAHNYLPLPIVITKADGVWMEAADGSRLMDMLSSYSALNQGHRHPAIIAALKAQADRVTLTSRAFHHEWLGPLCEQLCAYTGKAKILPMNTGAEAVETALKAARRWAYDVKSVPDGQAEIIVCDGNFHGRTITATSLSTTAEYKRGFGPFTPGFRSIPYGDLEALEAAIGPHTAAFLCEPIQGESGVILPPAGFLSSAAALCKTKGILFIADEIQTGLGRTGRRFACDWEGVQPDMYVIGKALGGGVLPVSAVAADEEVLGVFEPGSHGSTFGGNPLACAVALAAVRVVQEERLAERADILGTYFLSQLLALRHSEIKAVRGRGLLLGVEMNGSARPYCEALMAQGILCKETHAHVIRFAPPLIITREELDWALVRIRKVLDADTDRPVAPAVDRRSPP